MKKIFTITTLFVGLFTGLVSAQELSLRGFVESAYGGRVQTNSLIERDKTFNETRLQLKLSHFGELGEFFSAVDFLADNVQTESMEMNIREAYFQFGIGENADMKVGRQVLTWGTGDLVFINDLFPKDYISFFIGRDDQYLKLPSDAVKVGLFSSFANLDLIAMPSFAANRLPNGVRLSYFNPLAGSTVGETQLPAPLLPEEKFSETEFASRLYRYFGNFMGAGYFYKGFYKDPMGVNPFAGSMYYPELNAYGLSLRGPLFSGVVSLEYGYHDSREDSGGTNPLIPNSMHKYLAGFERQLWPQFTMGLQYYGEQRTDYDKYLLSLQAGMPVMDEFRHLFTTRMTQNLMYETLSLSLFAFYSPSDEDWHIRPNATYKLSDNISASAGGNFFGGEKQYTLFGQFENNNNVYTRLRYFF